MSARSRAGAPSLAPAVAQPAPARPYSSIVPKSLSPATTPLPLALGQAHGIGETQARTPTQTRRQTHRQASITAAATKTTAQQGGHPERVLNARSRRAYACGTRPIGRALPREGRAGNARSAGGGRDVGRMCGPGGARLLKHALPSTKRTAQDQVGISGPMLGRLLAAAAKHSGHAGPRQGTRALAWQGPARMETAAPVGESIICVSAGPVQALAPMDVPSFPTVNVSSRRPKME